MIKTYLLCFLFISLLSSCSSSSNQYQGVDDKIDSISAIENEAFVQEAEDTYQEKRRAAIERYRRLRFQRINRKFKTRTRPRATTYRPKPIPVRKKRIIHADPEIMSIEIEQKLSYYCMKNRKARRFSDEGSCHNFTQSNLETCREKFDIDDKNLLFCVNKFIH